MEEHERCKNPIDYDGELKMPYTQCMKRAARASYVADVTGLLSPAIVAAQILYMSSASVVLYVFGYAC